MRRQVRIAVSGGRASRRKKEPGILPAAYARSSMSTVSGKKSMPSRVLFSPLAVTRTAVSPILTTTAPWDWGASLPVSKERVLSSAPETGRETEMASAMLAHFLLCERRRRPVVSWLPPDPRAEVHVPGERRLATHRSRAALVSKSRTTSPEAGRRKVLPAEAELGVDRPVALDVVVAQVGLETPAVTDELQEAAPAVVVLLVDLEVLVELVDARRQE